MYNIILPGFRGSEKDIARKVLEEKGIDWKTRQVERYNARKRAKRIYWNNIKNELISVRTLSQQQFNLYLNACNALIFTSFSEGSPNVIKEAMAANTPIISVAVGDTKEVISNAQNCYIVNPDPHEMSEKLFITLKDGRRSNGREMISHLEISTIAKKLESVYYSILDNTKRGRNEK